MLFLDRNEWLFPYPDSVTLALQNSGLNVQSYARPDRITELKKQTAALFKTEPESIFFGHGSEDLILKLLLYFRASTSQLVVTDLSWPSYSDLALPLGFQVLETPLLKTTMGFSLDINRLIATLHSSKNAIVLLTTPNNPTGHEINANDLKDVATKFPNHTFIIDGVYDSPHSDVFQSLKSFQNCIYLYSFSKFFGLPGARIGFGSHADFAKRFQMPLGLHTPSVEIALASLRENQVFEVYRNEMLSFAENLRDEFANSSLKIFPTAAPFVLIELENLISFETFELLNAEVGIKPKVFIHNNVTMLRISLGPSATIGTKIKAYLKLLLKKL